MMTEIERLVADFARDVGTWEGDWQGLLIVNSVQTMHNYFHPDTHCGEYFKRKYPGSRLAWRADGRESRCYLSWETGDRILIVDGEGVFSDKVRGLPFQWLGYTQSAERNTVSFAQGFLKCSNPRVPMRVVGVPT